MSLLIYEKPGGTFQIGETYITLVQVGENRIRLKIDADDDVEIWRSDIVQRDLIASGWEINGDGTASHDQYGTMSIKQACEV